MKGRIPYERENSMDSSTLAGMVGSLGWHAESGNKGVARVAREQLGKIRSTDTFVGAIARMELRDINRREKENRRG